MFIVILLALIGAGILTGAGIWYVLAGIFFGISVLTSVLAIVGVTKVVKKAKKDFDKGFDSDFFREARTDFFKYDRDRYRR